MRVVAGTARGRRIDAPAGLDVRPTTDRVREATFNALTSLGAVAGARVLDLFAGSGALGIEALSRGAREATFVDPDARSRAAISSNLSRVGLDERAEVVAVDALRFLGGASGSRGRRAGAEPFDLVLCDPPYRYDGWDELFAALVAWLSPDAVVVIESDRPVDPPEGWHVMRDKAYGGTVVRIVLPPTDPTTSGDRQ